MDQNLRNPSCLILSRTPLILGADFEVDIRTYGDALFVLKDLGLGAQLVPSFFFEPGTCPPGRVRNIHLYTNNPDKMTALHSMTKEAQASSSAYAGLIPKT